MESEKFPKTWREYLEKHSFPDQKHMYTNGAMLISVRRVREMIERYFGNDGLYVHLDPENLE